MSISINTGFDLKSQIPLDKRLVFKTEALMRAADTKALYEGLISYVEDVEEVFILKRNNSNNLVWELLIDKTKMFDGKITFSDPTTAEVGGIKVGTTYTNEDISNVIYDLLHPYIPPTLSMEMNEAPGGYPKKSTIVLSTIKVTSVGGSFPAFKEKNISLAINDVVIDLNDASLAAAVIYNTDLTEVNIRFNNPISYTEADGDQKIVFSTTNANHTETIEAEYRFISPKYHWCGTTLIGDLTEANVISSEYTSDEYEDKLATVTYSSNGEYHNFAYPSSFGNLTKILDENGFDITNSYSYRSLLVDGEPYWIYQSMNISSLEKFDITFIA